MDIKEKARNYNKSGFNCAQSVLAACGEYTGLDEKTALAAAAGFGAGVRSGEICGAICGAVMAIGLSQNGDSSTQEFKTRAGVRTHELVKEFRENYGCVRCAELKRAGRSCDELIEYAAELAENSINKE